MLIGMRNMAKPNKKEQEKEKLFDEANIINRSIVWWVEQMEVLDKKIRKALKRPASEENDRIVEDLSRQLDTLMGKGELEIKNIDNWMKKKSKLK